MVDKIGSGSGKHGVLDRIDQRSDIRKDKAAEQQSSAGQKKGADAVALQVSGLNREVAKLEESSSERVKRLKALIDAGEYDSSGDKIAGKVDEGIGEEIFYDRLFVENE